jgi:hypothetical protein
LAEKLVPKSSQQKKERPSRGKRQLPAGLNQSKPERGKDDLPYEVGEVSFTSNAEIAKDRKKPRLVALTFCDLVSFDNTGKVNLMGCFDRIDVNRETNATGGFYLYVRTAETRKGHIDVTFLDPQNKPVAQAGYDIEVTDAEVPPGMPAHVQFYGRIAFGAIVKGVYWVDVTFNGESLGGRDLTISEPEEEGSRDERNNP